MRHVRLIPKNHVVLIRTIAEDPGEMYTEAYGRAAVPIHADHVVVEKAPNGRSQCRCCGFYIQRGEKRLTFEYDFHDREGYPSHYVEVHLHDEPCTWGDAHELIEGDVGPKPNPDRLRMEAAKARRRRRPITEDDMAPPEKCGPVVSRKLTPEEIEERLRKK